MRCERCPVRGPRREVQARSDRVLLRPRHDAGIRMSRFAEAPNDRTEVTMKQTQPNAHKLTAVPVNGARLRRLRSARIALTG